VLFRSPAAARIEGISRPCRPRRAGRGSRRIPSEYRRGGALRDSSILRHTPLRSAQRRAPASVDPEGSPTIASSASRHQADGPAGGRDERHRFHNCNSDGIPRGPDQRVDCLQTRCLGDTSVSGRRARLRFESSATEGFVPEDSRGTCWRTRDHPPEIAAQIAGDAHEDS